MGGTEFDAEFDAEFGAAGGDANNAPPVLNSGVGDGSGVTEASVTCWRAGTTLVLEVH
jgi:hypothetical protein